MPTYANLFGYLTSLLKDEAMGGCDHTLRFTKQFAETYKLSFEGLSRILEETGGHCDCEVLLNSAHLIPHDDVIGKETFKTPVQIAVERGLYAHCRVDGQPVSLPEALAAKEAGRKVEMWVPCGKDDPHAMPDLVRTIERPVRSDE